MSSYFASRHRKDLSTEMIRTKIAHRKSLSQKENRYKEYERNRHFGLKDVNIPTLQSKTFVELDETSQELAPEKANIKPKSMKTILSDQRKQMLQKYKEEKQLQKLKEQREKAKRGVFKVGLYRPDIPSFFSTTQTVRKAEPKKATSSSVRITRSKAKDQVKPTKIPTRSDVQAAQPDERQATSRRAPDRENRVVPPVSPPPIRVTRSATQATQQVPRTIPSAPVRKPTSRAARDTEPERKALNKGRPATKTETKADKVISSKVQIEEKTSQTSATSETDPNGVPSKVEQLPKTHPAKTRGKNSFAPTDFVFQPLDGVKSYQVMPMTPRSAEAFLTPCYTWELLKPQGDKMQETRKEILGPKCKTYSTKALQQDSSNLPCPLDSETVFKEEHVFNQNEVASTDSGVLSVKEALPPAPEPCEGPIPQPQHDVLYFRNVLRSEAEKLTLHCLAWDRKLELDIPDDAKDLIRTAVGQTRLLMKERFKQFEGLVDDCEYKRGEKKTTCTDLDGFWDMVSFQIEDVNKKFINLMKLEESEWQNNNANKKVLRKKPARGAASKPREDDRGRAAARSRLAAIKSAMRERLRWEEQAGAGAGPGAGAEAEAEAAAPPRPADTIVFDAGFFRVESPAKSFSGAPSCERLSQRLRTPKSVTSAVPEHRVDLALHRQTTLPENPGPWSAQRGHGDKKTLLSNIPESRNIEAEGAQCSGSQDFTDMNPDINKTNFEMSCLPGETMSSHLAGGVADDATTNKEETSGVVELNSSFTTQDVLMSSPEKNSPSQNNILQEAAAKTSQPVLFDTKGLTTEYHLLDSPGLAGSDPFASAEWGRPRGTRLISFGGNLIAFSPLRPSEAERPEDL
ncbi:Disks large-associated protein 5 [Heterocephalus glaber]|uniref:Disks large-associated protein 5 n=1 Tax=Heterocephalus glaber TaxID=10181 RepID=G5BF75_HETGA|nr:disks large-associated protein 5 isoform X2 [Heterocephalus glaber]EHB07936.1 Disks large-associated protein 5 [Heterocephalus glaber]